MQRGLYISFAYITNPVFMINIEAEHCLDPKNKKQTYNIARHTSDQ